MNIQIALYLLMELKEAFDEFNQEVGYGYFSTEEIKDKSSFEEILEQVERLTFLLQTIKDIMDYILSGEF